MYAVLVSRWRNKEAVLDAIQDAFERLIKNLPSLGAISMGQIHSWLMTAAVNRLKDQSKNGNLSQRRRLR